MVPVFTENRSIGLAPSSAPAASPRLRRRPSPWPPRRHRIPATESTAQHARSCATSRPISTRFESVTRLRSFNTGSSRIPSDLARRTRPAWQSQAIPALSALLTALPSVSWIRLRSAPTRLLRQPSEEAFHLLRFPAPHGALRLRVASPVDGPPRHRRRRPGRPRMLAGGQLAHDRPALPRCQGSIHRRLDQRPPPQRDRPRPLAAVRRLPVRCRHLRLLRVPGFVPGYPDHGRPAMITKAR